ncbi:MAG TPA: sensor histidine kinase [Planctomycetota bacterium]|jgi:signal transduction histidine kinase
MLNRIANLLRKKRGAILSGWVQAARQEIPATKDMDEGILRDKFDILIERLIESLEQEQAATPLRPADGGAEHGLQRATIPTYNIKQMLQEYITLRSSIFDVLEQDEQLNVQDREAMLVVLFETFQAAAGAFSDSRVQAEKSGRIASEEIVRQLQVEREMRETFVACLSHDLRTPMAIIKNCVHLLFRTGDKEEARNRLTGKINESVDRMDRMIRDLLDISLVRAGKKLKLILDEFEMQRFLENTAQEQNVVYGPRIFVQSAASQVMGWWSESQLQRAVENLCANAIKYGAENAPVRMSQRQTGDRVQITVHNEGNPIKPEDQKHIFEPYNRSGATKEKGGWGLGLTLVQGVAQSHGGSVSAKSNAAEGTTFTIDLPLDARPFVEKTRE